MSRAARFMFPNHLSCVSYDELRSYQKELVVSASPPSFGYTDTCIILVLGKLPTSRIRIGKPSYRIYRISILLAGLHPQEPRSAHRCASTLTLLFVPDCAYPAPRDLWGFLDGGMTEVFSACILVDQPTSSMDGLSAMRLFLSRIMQHRDPLDI